MLQHAFAEARAEGFRAVQFNFVVRTRSRGFREKHGKIVLDTLPIANIQLRSNNSSSQAVEGSLCWFHFLHFRCVIESVLRQAAMKTLNQSVLVRFSVGFLRLAFGGIVQEKRLVLADKSFPTYDHFGSAESLRRQIALNRT